MAIDQQDAPLRTFHPRWPDRTTIDPERVTFRYWREIDTLIVDFTGENPPAVSVPLDLGGDRDYVYLRLDPITERVLGLQIEDFLSDAIYRHPSLLDTLDLATLHGVTPAEIAQLRRDLAVGPRKGSAVFALFDDFAALNV